jgi:adenylosuccinate lyase
MLRERAYELVQGYAMRAWEEELDFRELVSRDADIASLLPPEQLARSFSLDRQLRNVDAIFARVFPNQS